MKPIDEAVAAKLTALMVSGLRGLAKPKPPEVVPEAAILLDWARERRLGRLALWAPAHSPAALALYRQAGFRETGNRKPLPANPALPTPRCATSPTPTTARPSHTSRSIQPDRKT